ncbi:2,3-diketo-5-methylthio-1-phosphopentane phosphatase [Methylomonas lenta]|uniref:Enolase-phosphatase E1 n=1 Tax=Methylomonas lenta TaxID=980561 RepID=A0A177N0B0_9GAMM|nr:acireductone synthase [Methylomonas lenta]OAI11386.1 2,3-diketo-5-methylthio-1-phosphopentane phosphatase [Methylomonas lenta]
MIKAIVTDIEGTTSSLSFVKDVLFPYARQHLPDFVRQHAESATVKPLLDTARTIAGLELDLEQLISQFLQWIDQDQKITPLKSLQGLIWQDGYQQGAFKGHIYEDAAKQLKAWKQQGYALYVYSSGSVHAQKLLFSHTEYGDLTPLFSGYFDTHIGAKQETAAYQAIARQIQLPADEILFLSDIKAELDAARDAGLNTYWLVREQKIVTDAEHRQVNDFNAITL